MPDALRPVLRCTDATKTLRDLLQVNDLSVVHKNHAELVQFIKAGGGKLSMVLLASAQQMPIPHTAYPISVTRGPDGFGFNLGRKGNVHYFKGVDAGSAALAAGASLNALIFEVRVQCTTSMHIVIDARHSRGLFWSVPTSIVLIWWCHTVVLRLFFGDRGSRRTRFRTPCPNRHCCLCCCVVHPFNRFDGGFTQVNSVGVSGLTHSDVVKLIKAGGTTVVFKILQDGGQYVQVRHQFWPEA